MQEKQGDKNYRNNTQRPNNINKKKYKAIVL